MVVTIWSEKVPNYEERFAAMAYATQFWINHPEICKLELLPKE